MKKFPRVRLAMAFTVKKGDRDARGRWLRPGPRFKVVREGEPGYKHAALGVMFMEIMPRFRMKRRRRVSAMFTSRPPFSNAKLEKAGYPWLLALEETYKSRAPKRAPIRGVIDGKKPYDTRRKRR